MSKGSQARDTSGPGAGGLGADFLQPVLEDCAGRIVEATGDPGLAGMFVQAMRNTLDTTLFPENDGTTFVITGDIPAMWLRDSSAQMRPFLRLLEFDERLYGVIAGLVARQFECVALDSYANAFNREPNGASYDPADTSDNPWLWERKYEIDSLAFPVKLAHQLWQRTGRTDIFSESVRQGFGAIVAQWRLEQDHEANSSYRFVRQTELPSETLSRDGLGPAAAVTGMTWAGFRPSDDACVYSYNVPGNHFAKLALEQIGEIAGVVYQDAELAAEALALAADIAAGIARHGVVSHPDFGDIYAYEVDGLGNALLMDDANMPSLLSLPLTGGVEAGDPVYQATRAFILSKGNPYFYQGSQAEGIGSPHTPEGYIWPIALAVQGLTASTRAEKWAILQTLRDTTGGTGSMHEGFNPDDPGQFTRPWFSWANSMFCELLMDYCDGFERNDKNGNPS
jgi:meiotically up-regulated gene 157 (Mug157) protein